MPTVFHSSQARLRHGLLTNATQWRHKQQQQRQYRQQLQQNASNECLAIIIQFNFQQTSVAAPFLISLYLLFALPTACVNVWRPLSLSLFAPVSRSLSFSLYAVFIVEYGCVCVCVRVSCSARKCSHLLNDRLPAPWSRLLLLPGESPAKLPPHAATAGHTGLDDGQN